MLSYLRRRSRLNSVDDYDGETLVQLMTLVRGLLTSHALPLVERSPALLSLYRKVQIRIAVLMKMGMLSRDRFYRLRAAGHVVRYDKGVPAISKALRKMLETTERCPGNKKEQRAFEKYSVLYYKWWHSAFHTPRFEEDIAEHDRRDAPLDILDELLCDMLLHVEAPASSKFKSKKSQQSVYGPRRASLENFSDVESEQEKANHYSVHTGQIQNVFAKMASRRTDLAYGRPGAVQVVQTRPSARDAFPLALSADQHSPGLLHDHRSPTVTVEGADSSGSGTGGSSSSAYTRNSQRRRASDESTGMLRRASDEGKRSLLQAQGNRIISTSHSNVSQNANTNANTNGNAISFASRPQRANSIGARSVDDYGKKIRSSQANGAHAQPGDAYNREQAQGAPVFKRSSIGGETKDNHPSSSSVRQAGFHGNAHSSATQPQTESEPNLQPSREGAVATMGFAMSAAMGMGIDAIALLAKKSIPIPSKLGSPSKQLQIGPANPRGYTHGYQDPQNGPSVNDMRMDPTRVPTAQEGSRSDSTNTSNKSLGVSQSVGLTSLTGKSSVYSPEGSASNSNSLQLNEGTTSQNNSGSVLYERDAGSGREDGGGSQSKAKKIMTVLRHSSMTSGLGVSSSDKKKEKERERERGEEGEMGFKTDARASVSVEQQQPIVAAMGAQVTGRSDSTVDGSVDTSINSLFSGNTGVKLGANEDSNKSGKYHGSEHRKNRWKNRVMRSLAKRKSGEKEQQKRNMAPRGTVWGPRPGILLTTPPPGPESTENARADQAGNVNMVQREVSKPVGRQPIVKFVRRRSSLT
ncbi:hypothetical protein SARC_09024 [Sphaeroforma arctica JP610]|uniref:Uncharacterized protein n=1 Tax=Sphaeroforma arctica JP610 TaxID=667725 RepID=A0A0L0FPW2_9EUKA|nr:hypothetical protein SARC_09024 [Sphaeroforma arctica JP610]KNC78551.1 hypothetical protein SARC_09024 [Sphaeroforma arctica JP610]|eukprot:XP_014152453.1 hypothetical protein SARC_09024 [Sphaeroforma arctica JP610]